MLIGCVKGEQPMSREEGIGPALVVGGAKGEVYVTEAFAGQVSKVESNGEKTVVAKDLKMPEGIALTPDGKLIVAEVGAKRLVQIDPQNGNLTEIAANLPIAALAATVPARSIPGTSGDIRATLPSGVEARASL